MIRLVMLHRYRDFIQLQSSYWKNGIYTTLIIFLNRWFFLNDQCYIIYITSTSGQNQRSFGFDFRLISSHIMLQSRQVEIITWPVSIVRKPV